MQDEVILRLKELLKSKGVKQSYIAEQLGVSTSMVSKIMRGESRIYLDTLLQIAKVLEVDPASLIPSSSDGKPKQSFEDYVRAIIRDEHSRSHQD